MAADATNAFRQRPQQTLWPTSSSGTRNDAPQLGQTVWRAMTRYSLNCGRCEANRWLPQPSTCDRPTEVDPFLALRAEPKKWHFYKLFRSALQMTTVIEFAPAS